MAALALLAELLATLLFPLDYRADVVILIPWIAMATFILSRSNSSSTTGCM